MFPWIGERLCPACRVGEENLCDKPRSLGVYNDGGYAEYVLVPRYKYLAKIHDLDTDNSAPLSCSALTAYGAVKNAQLKPNGNVVNYNQIVQNPSTATKNKNQLRLILD